MTKDEFIANMLPMIMKIDLRLQVHSFYENEDCIYVHNRDMCPRCEALKRLNIQYEM